MRLCARTSGPLSGIATIPGDKSCSHRALILGALAHGETAIAHMLEADDVMATVRALRAFGVEVDKVGTEWRVRGDAWRSPTEPIDCGNSGTTARLLMGAVAGMPIRATFDGDDSLRRRPMDRVVEPLRRMGAQVDGGPHLPMTVSGGQLDGIEHRNLPPSAQVKSAILFAGLQTDAEVIVEEPIPSRDHSEIMLREFGCDVEVRAGQVKLGARRRLEGCTLQIAADPSSAAFAWLAAAIVPGSEVTVRDVLLNSRRAGFIVALQRMGGDIALDNVRGRHGETIGDVRVRDASLFAAEFTGEEIPSMIDEIPALAVAAAFANGETLIEGVGELRHKESDRLAAIVAGLTACGVEAAAEGDVLRVVGARSVPGGAEVHSANDHRIAMAFAVLGLAAERPVTVDGAEMIGTSFPAFAQSMRDLGAELNELE